MTTKPIGQPTSLAELDIAVIGAGPVGLMMANLLGLSGVEVAVLEGSEGVRGMPRAIAYDAETLRLFGMVGPLGEIAPELVQGPRVRHVNARGRTLMEMDFPACGPYGHSPLGTFYQPQFENVLLHGVSRFSNVRTLFGHMVTGLQQCSDHAVLTVSTPEGVRTLQAKFIVACDGGTSRVRDMLSSTLVGSTFAQQWLVVDAIVNGHDVRQVSFHCDPRRPRVEMPAVGDRVRWEFMRLPGERQDELLAEDRIHSLIADNFGGGSIRIERKAVYTFHARVADRWRNGRGFLAGDAAHLMPPFAGQGMNSGLKDAVNLAWKIAYVIKGLAPAALLDTYEAERAPVVRRLVNVSRRLGFVIMPTNRGVALARDCIFACLNMSRRFRAFIRRGGVLPPPAIGRSTLTAGGRDPLIGQMIPQPHVRSPQGTAPLDTFQACHQWLALGIGIDPTTMLSPRDLAILKALGTGFVCLNGNDEGISAMALQCDDPAFAAWVKRHAVRAVLVRPDRFIAARIDPQGRDVTVLNMFAASSPEAAPRIAA
ncbi:bifunctional 3-(3-hydroxy-phenyl)propionate/3-hydroxycinnamic acid hydroxylase [Microvirga yunnanensis]|uniref:bifunctional 3-(3-hydroxy-phenyl)propionate/3-hydroxycinnamic acid hydroxylase n=1 Tax=Microvirga yunnanensis TaxID=2953740 RepID=UPI0021C82BE6|nr:MULTISPECIES: bifunctional 3-(3-hydroxy-phenyl)propionate/3-hydroxycinnamic acid hydroxylase [unclassified Microvirga]